MRSWEHPRSKPGKVEKVGKRGKIGKKLGAPLNQGLFPMCSNFCEQPSVGIGCSHLRMLWLKAVPTKSISHFYLIHFDSFSSATAFPSTLSEVLNI